MPYCMADVSSDQDSNIVRHKSDPHLEHVVYTRTRCGPDLCHHYVVVRVGVNEQKYKAQDR